MCFKNSLTPCPQGCNNVTLHFDCFTFFPRCTRGSIQSTVTREWEFRNLVRFCAFISSEKSLHQDHHHSNRHHNCFRHYSFASTSNWSTLVTTNERNILGEFNFFTSYMSQPKFQLETFKVNIESRYWDHLTTFIMKKAIVSKHYSVDVQAWAGLGSDISYYLNSHHIDLHVWAMQARNTFITLIILVTSVITIIKKP